MIPFPFEELQKILELNADEIDTDNLIFNATLSFVEKNLGFNIEDKNYNELQTVKDCKVYTEQEHISEMVNIIDMNTKERVPNCVIDEKRNIVFLLSSQYENHVLFLNYNAGFTRDSLPADLKEAVIKLFIIKRNDFFNKMNNCETESNGNIPEDIQNIFNIYKRKCL